MTVTFRILAGVFLAIGITAQAHAASEFQYSIPPGWRDLRDALHPANGVKDVDNIPQQLMTEAASGRYTVVAVDPEGTTSRQVGASFNVVEAPKTQRVTLDVVNGAGDSVVKQLRSGGLRPTLIEARVSKLNGVNVGIITIDATSDQGTRRLLQYLIPGHKSLAVLTYAAPQRDFSRYLPAFEASALATRGAYEPGWFNWKSFFVSGAIGGLVAMAASLVMSFMRKRRDALAGITEDGAEAAHAPSPPKKASKYVWECPACGNPVPIRLTQCRCGAAKPP
jgi:hypothetical protein